MRQITIDGRLGRDAEVSTGKDGRQYIKFSVANTLFKDGEEKTEWFDITSFDSFIVNKKVKALTKGSYVIVTGSWETDTNVSPKDNQLYINHRVIANSVDVPKLGKSQSDGATVAATPTVQVPSVPTPSVETPTINIPSLESRLNNTPAPAAPQVDEADDDLPF